MIHSDNSSDQGEPTEEENFGDQSPQGLGLDGGGISLFLSGVESILKQAQKSRKEENH